MTQAPAINLHHHANTGGFGSGKAALIAAGAWDENRGKPNRTWRVTVTYQAECEITVTARSADEAKGKICLRDLERERDDDITEIIHIEPMQIRKEAT